jgi:hypothetical protein
MIVIVLYVSCWFFNERRGIINSLLMFPLLGKGFPYGLHTRRSSFSL